MLVQLTDKIDKTEIIANMIFISLWVISIIAIITAMCQFSNNLSCRIISTVCSLLIVALTFFNEKSSDSGYKILYSKSQEARVKLSSLKIYLDTYEPREISRNKVVKDIISINSILPNVYVPNFMISLFSFTLVFADNDQNDESFIKEIERSKNKLTKYFKRYPEIIKRNITIPIFLNETETFKSIKVAIKYDNNCTEFSGMYAPSNKGYKLVFPPIINSDVIQFEIRSEKEQISFKDGILFQFSMYLYKKCIESKIVINKSLIDESETNSIGIYVNENFTYEHTLEYYPMESFYQFIETWRYSLYDYPFIKDIRVHRSKDFSKYSEKMYIMTISSKDLNNFFFNNNNGLEKLIKQFNVKEEINDNILTNKEKTFIHTCQAWKNFLFTENKRPKEHLLKFTLENQFPLGKKFTELAIRELFGNNKFKLSGKKKQLSTKWRIGSHNHIKLQAFTGYEKYNEPAPQSFFNIFSHQKTKTKSHSYPQFSELKIEGGDLLLIGLLKKYGECKDIPNNKTSCKVRVSIPDIENETDKLIEVCFQIELNEKIPNCIYWP